MSVPAAKSGGLAGGQARHVAIIMDGNGRWAKKRHVPRALGHQKGVEAVRALVRGAAGLGIEVLTLYAFSTENWQRPEDEISDLTRLMKRFILSDLDEMADNNIRLKIIGDYSAFTPDLVELIERALERTKANTGSTIAVALNYGSMDEIARAARLAAAKGAITPETIAANLDTADLPPLDLLIRTSGEERLSNFLLWQAAYAELWFTEVLWPDFTADHLKQALDAFAIRERHYGGR